VHFERPVNLASARETLNKSKIWRLQSRLNDHASVRSSLLHFHHGGNHETGNYGPSFAIGEVLLTQYGQNIEGIYMPLKYFRIPGAVEPYPVNL
jgi:hypothetical protein